MELHELSLSEVSQKIKSKEISIPELLQDNLDRIKNIDPHINSFVYDNSDAALKKAEELQAHLDQATSPLYGIPLALKDIFSTQGSPATCCSKILENHIATYSSTAYKKLEEQGVLLTGKLNMDEFAMGSSNETSCFGPVKNPWNLDCIPGGSSGGSAAAVAAGLSYASLGTDTGGSIRQPASLCGIVGLKPTYGRVSRYGVIAFASSLDQVGPMTKNVQDAALMLECISGHDPLDSTSVKKEVPQYSNFLNQDIKGMKLGIPKEYFDNADGSSNGSNGSIDPEVMSAVKKAIRCYEDLGAEIVEVSLPHTEYAVPTYYIIAPAEASSNLSRYDGVRYGNRTQGASSLHELYEETKSNGFGTEVKRRIMLGSYVLSAGYYDAYYLKAQKVRTLIKNDFISAFEKVDALLTPTAPEPAFKIGAKTENPLSMYLSDIFTINVNLAGLPALSLPCGLSQNNLPIGLQIIAPHFEEAKLIQIAHAYEQANDWQHRRPNLESLS